MAHLTDRNQGEMRPISSHRTVRRKAHRLLGQKIDLRYPQASSRRACSRRAAARACSACARLTGSCGGRPEAGAADGRTREDPGGVWLAVLPV